MFNERRVYRQRFKKYQEQHRLEYLATTFATDKDYYRYWFHYCRLDCNLYWKRYPQGNKRSRKPLELSGTETIYGRTVNLMDVVNALAPDHEKLLADKLARESGVSSHDIQPPPVQYSGMKMPSDLPPTRGMSTPSPMEQVLYGNHLNSNNRPDYMGQRSMFTVTEDYYRYWFKVNPSKRTLHWRRRPRHTHHNATTRSNGMVSTKSIKSDSVLLMGETLRVQDILKQLNYIN